LCPPEVMFEIPRNRFYGSLQRIILLTTPWTCPNMFLDFLGVRRFLIEIFNKLFLIEVIALMPHGIHPILS
ncbi:MAG: hypothetical protein ACMUIL_09835, partial [bacterium]